MAKKTDSIEVRTGAGGDSAYIAGTRVRVSDVARLYRLAHEELIIEKMTHSLPHLTETQIKDALAYWRSHNNDIETEILEEDALIASIPIR